MLRKGHFDGGLAGQPRPGSSASKVVGCLCRKISGEKDFFSNIIFEIINNISYLYFNEVRLVSVKAYFNLHIPKLKC